MKIKFITRSLLFSTLMISHVTGGFAQHPDKGNVRDERVREFLEEKQQQWQNLNVPYADGQILYDLIIENNYQSALEIGTSTGHSTVWISWALSRTGGHLITIEIDEERQKEAMENLEAAGLSDFVEFKLGDAHQLVQGLEGSFDFVFSDADKEWYVQYFKDIHPKLRKGGCFTAHNVLQSINGIREYMDFVRKHPDYTTTVEDSSSSGIAISYKK